MRTQAPSESRIEPPAELDRKKIKVAHVATVDMSLRYMLLSQMLHLREAGYEVHGICAPGPELEAVRAEGLEVHTAPFTRRINLVADLRALVSLYLLLRRGRFDIVHTHTPKASLLGQVAGWLARTPVRFNTVHGFYFHEHMAPRLRRFYVGLERVTAFCSHRILSQNAEDVETAVREKICPPAKIRALGNGIDISRFDPTRVSLGETRALRRELGIPEESPVVGFVGRLVAEKGIVELLEAAKMVRQAFPNVRFLFVGPSDREKADAIDPNLAAKLDVSDFCVFTGRRSDMPAIYALMDVNVLPSHREGYPRTPMEASLMRRPSVVTNIRGCRETVEHGANGLLTPVRDAKALAEAINRLLGDEKMRAAMGETGRRMALAKFDERRVHDTIEKEYASLLRRNQESRQRANAAPSPARRSESTGEPGFRGSLSNGLAYRGKRLFDLVLAVLLLPAALPLGAVSAALVYLSLGRPIFFQQVRPGLHGKPFTIFKFRTMTGADDSVGQPLPDSQRLTRIGRLLRRSSLDELPELFNVLRGEMSIVGPRPLLVRYLPFFSPTERLRFTVKPGITGWAQVNGRNRLDWDERLRCDVWYAQNAKLSLDIRILARTIFQALTGANVEVAPDAAMLDLDEYRSKTRIAQES